MIRYYSVVLFVKDIEKAKHFYCDLLSMPVETDMGKNVILKLGITLWEIDEKNIIVRIIGKEEIGKGNRSELYFETDNMAEIEQVIKENNIKKLHDTHEEPWGQRTVRFYDYDSNIIEAGEQLSTFLDRLVKSGLSREELQNKTGMKIEDIEKSIGYKI